MLTEFTKLESKKITKTIKNPCFSGNTPEKHQKKAEIL